MEFEDVLRWNEDGLSVPSLCQLSYEAAVLPTPTGLEPATHGLTVEVTVSCAPDINGVVGVP
jgi:hypothetical protein